jgi:hypothetical protein
LKSNGNERFALLENETVVFMQKKIAKARRTRIRPRIRSLPILSHGFCRKSIEQNFNN